MIWAIKSILEVIGLLTITWFVVIAYEEYVKLKKEKENKDG